MWPVEFEHANSADAFSTLDGDEVRIAGVVAPGSDGENVPAAILAASRAALAGMIESRPLLLAPTSQERDRYGRLTAQIFVDGEWLQGKLLRAGWVPPDIASNSCAGALLEAESEARTAQAGFWADGYFSVLSVEQLMEGERRFAGSFQTVEGMIVEVGDYRGRYFLNFGEDHRTDFTVTIAPADMRNFRAAGLDLNMLEGKRVRVRGWLESYNGPNLPVSVPGAIEVLN